jgi:hypothetical protein
MGMADAHANIPTQKSRGETTGTALVTGDLVGGAGVDVAAGEASDQLQLADLARVAKLFGVPVKAICEEDNGMIRLVAQGKLGKAGSGLTTGLGVAREPVRLGLKVAAEKGESYRVSPEAAVCERCWSAKANDGCVPEQAGNAGDNVTRGVLVGANQDAESGRADTETIEGLVGSLETGFTPIKGLSGSDSGLDGHRGFAFRDRSSSDISLKQRGCVLPGQKIGLLCMILRRAREKDDADAFLHTQGKVTDDVNPPTRGW